MWVARDEGGRLFIYTECPERDDNIEEWLTQEGGDASELPEDMFPGLTWEDEPMEVEIITKKKDDSRRN